MVPHKLSASRSVAFRELKATGPRALVELSALELAERAGRACPILPPSLDIPGGGRPRLGTHHLPPGDPGGPFPKVEAPPCPGSPPALPSIAVVAAPQREGTVLIHEKLFESRLFFTDRLASMGARLILCDPHRVVVTGPSRLVGQDLVSPDIRAGMALLIAALCAEGESTIHNVQQIDRGYERIETKLGLLGADIRRVAR